MKRSVCAAVAAVGLVAGAARADTNPNTGRDFVAQCKSEAESIRGFCEGYLLGVTEALAVAREICAPPRTKAEDLRYTFLAYAARLLLESVLDGERRLVVSMALHESYKCLPPPPEPTE